MNLNRRHFLVGGGVLAGAAFLGRPGSARPRAASALKPIDIQARAISYLSVLEPERTRFDGLVFRSGLELRCADERFGGFSGLWRSPDGAKLVALADNAQWLTADVETRDGKLAGLSEAVLAPVLNEAGKRLSTTPYYDTESFAVGPDGTAYIGIERRHAVMRLDWGRQGVLARARLLPLPEDLAEQIKDLPNNSGLEALGVAPPRSPLAGAVVAVAEHAYRGDSPNTLGFILTGPQRGTFLVERSGGYDVSDMAFLPDGDLLLLERQFGLFTGFRIRIRRVAGSSLRPDASVSGSVLFESGPTHQIDNMEGLAVFRRGGDIILTLISDDNFSRLQRTLLLEFALPG
ncbi:esterase-like activity of phytase family protein [Microvirga pudoricolor]|uniref:esterase-like activity of phytase family protein n=1 Tax=Microvirga pudoricolor TaxID=2778729 RepID=UPI00194E2630|nr:esterase-like activity of phytase family protein [Microvirga pudoricolor]MBM6593516.1 esterase-like activity of phytase family protein [Microvirga pudoricolor]